MIKSEIEVLLIEDDEVDAVLVKKALRNAATRMNIHCVQSMELAMAAIRHVNFDVILVDLSLPDCDMHDTIKVLSPFVNDKPIVILTGLDDQTLANSLIEAGAQDYVIKGSTSDRELERCICYAIQRQNNVLKNLELMNQLREKHRLVARKNVQLGKLYAQAHEFVDNVSHEFRTPLTVIKEYVSLVREGFVGPVNEEQKRMLAISEDRVEDLNIMVDDMLDTSKLEAGMMRASRVSCDIEDVFSRVRPWLERKSRLKEIDIHWAIDSDLPRLYCDPEKVSRIVTNLTINAVKFCGSPGEIRIGAQSIPSKREIAISICDNGPGLDETARKQIFDRFKQLDNSVHQSTKGFGLGLSITKQLVDLNFGELTVESEVGFGSTYAFTLPMDQPAEILRRYIAVAQRSAQSESVSPVVSFVNVTVDGVIADELQNETNSFLNCCLRKNDLLIRLERNRWLIALPEFRSEVQQYFKRMEVERQQLNRNRPQSLLPEISFDLSKSISIFDSSIDIETSVGELLHTIAKSAATELDKELVPTL